MRRTFACSAVRAASDWRLATGDGRRWRWRKSRAWRERNRNDCRGYASSSRTLAEISLPSARSAAAVWRLPLRAPTPCCRDCGRLSADGSERCGSSANGASPIETAAKAGTGSATAAAAMRAVRAPWPKSPCLRPCRQAAGTPHPSLCPYPSSTKRRPRL